MAEKLCRKCGTVKPLEMFYVERRSKGTTHCNACKVCRGNELARWRKKNRDKVRRYNNKWSNEIGRYRRYGITKEDYDAMLAFQHGVCAICGNPEPDRAPYRGILHIDHDHETGQVRGLLCSACNTALGKLRDDPLILLSAAMYLLTGQKMNRIRRTGGDALMAWLQHRSC